MNSSVSISTPSRTTRSGTRRAFSIIEVVVVVGLMSFIVLGLVIMFGQTQRAYKLGTTQVDVLEGGRATLDMMGRELAVITPARGSNVVNFYADIPFVGPLVQVLPGAKPINRINSIYDLYFLTRDNQTWTGVGYQIANRASGVGTLYRYEQTMPVTASPQRMFNNFYFNYTDSAGPNKTATNLNSLEDKQLNLSVSRVVDGVVHFRVRAYDFNGLWITNEFAPPNDAGFKEGTNIWLEASTLIPGEIRYRGLYSNLVPASVELELGILENGVLAKAKAISDLNRRYDYLTNQASKVHLFRLRVPVRNVDPSAYQ